MSKAKNSVFGIGFLLLIMVLALTVQLAAAKGPPTEQDGVVIWHGNSGSGNAGAVEGSSARLLRTDRNLSGTLHTKQLNPGHVYTLWWIVIDNPEACANIPCSAPEILNSNNDPLNTVNANVTYGGGIVAGKNGKGTLSSHLAEGDLPDGWTTDPFENARGAEVHLVVNDHGPKIPGMTGEMLHTYRGGCKDLGLPGIFPDTAINDGTPGPNTCHLYQAAIFLQP